MKKYAIALDLDATLLNDLEQITTKQINYLNNLINNDNLIIIVTGRSFLGCREILKELPKNTPIISDNGNHISSIDGSVDDLEDIVDILSITAIIKDMKDIIKHAYFKTLTSIYAYNYKELLGFLYQTTKQHKLIEFDESTNLSDTSTSITFIIDSTKMRIFEDYILNLNLVYNLVGHDYKNAIYNVSKDIINKGTTLKKYLNKIENKLEIISIGDGPNDIPMFKISDISVSMKNGSNDVINNALHTTQYDNNEDGVYHFLNSIIKNNAQN